MRKNVLEHEAQAADLMALQPRLFLFDSMGIGKTVSALMGLRKATEGLLEPFRCIVCVPNTLIEQWRLEIASWVTPWEFQCVVATGDPTQRLIKYDFFMSYDGNIILLTNYNLLVRDAFFREVSCQAVVLDEVYLLRNSGTKLYKYLLSFLPRFDRVYFLSGNASAFSDVQFYNLVELMFPGEYAFCNKDTLISLLGDRYISRGFEVVPRMLDNVPTVDYVPLELIDKQKELLSQVAVENNQAKKNRVSYKPRKFYQKRLEVLLSNRLFDSSGVLSPKESFLIKKLSKSGGKTVVYCGNRKFYRLLRSDFNSFGISFEALSGEMSLERRTRALNIFINDLNCRCLLITGIGKLGLNLGVADELICMTVPLNRVELEQLIGRLRRLTQTHPIRCYIPYYQDSDEEVLVEKLRG